ncbi:dnaJ-like protein 60 [Eupeodes corollae]|uniref:dnaJ-like protein 60 n=1 Tax=Eupeodes corollae TaxID=290404 RepID=UPI00248F811B|nr:dnaJ-like protein 60 [Eupeodes corollae]
MFYNHLLGPFYLFNQLNRSFSSDPPTHYDVLNLKKNCTAEEIREAFLILSKKFHPDVKGANTDPKDTAKFVKISEAYQVLSKSITRDAYDQDLLTRSFGGGGSTSTSRGFKKPEVHRPWEVKPNFDPNPGPYYGIKGVRKVSNATIVMLLIGFATIGVAIGFMSVRKSFEMNRNQLDITSKEAGEHHAAVRINAQKFGNDEQLKRMVDRMLNRPT